MKKTLIIILSIVFITVFSNLVYGFDYSTNCTDVIGVWDFIDGNGTTVTDICGVKNGVITDSGGSTWYNLTTPTGDSSSWGSNDAGLNDYVTASSISPDLDNFSWEAWVYFTPPTGGSDRLMDTGRFQLNIWTDQYATCNNGTVVNTATTPLISNSWYHVAVVKTPDNISLYINGSKIASSYCGNNMQSFTYIDFATANARSPVVQFDFVRVTNYAIKCDPSEISDNTSKDVCSYYYVAPLVNNPPYYSGSINNLTFNYNNYSSINVGQNYYILDDNAGDLINCSLYINSSIIYNWTSINNNTQLNYTYISMSKHNIVSYYYNCTDGQNNNISDTKYLIYENTACSNSANPTNYNFNDTETKTYSNTVTDLDGDNMTVLFYWNGALNQTNTSISTGSTVSIDKDLVLHTDYTHQWRCYDDYQASNTTTALYTTTFDNAAPVFNPALSTQTLLDNETLSYQVNCTDANNDNITFYLNTTDGDMTISATGLIEDNTVVSQDVGVICGDGYENTTSSFRITVVQASAASGGGSSSLGIGIILVAVLFAYLLLSFKLDDDHQALKFGYILYSLFMIVGLLYVAWQLFNFNYTQSYAEYNTVQNALLMLFRINIPILVFSVGYFIYYYIYRVVVSIGKKHKK